MQRGISLSPMPQVVSPRSQSVHQDKSYAPSAELQHGPQMTLAVSASLTPPTSAPAPTSNKHSTTSSNSPRLVRSLIMQSPVPSTTVVQPCQILTSLSATSNSSAMMQATPQSISHLSALATPMQTVLSIVSSTTVSQAMQTSSSNIAM